MYLFIIKIKTLQSKRLHYIRLPLFCLLNRITSALTCISVLLNSCWFAQTEENVIEKHFPPLSTRGRRLHRLLWAQLCTFALWINFTIFYTKRNLFGDCSSLFGEKILWVTIQQTKMTLSWPLAHGADKQPFIYWTQTHNLIRTLLMLCLYNHLKIDLGPV